jgi:hypothetical protein
MNSNYLMNIFLKLTVQKNLINRIQLKFRFNELKLIVNLNVWLKSWLLLIQSYLTIDMNSELFYEYIAKVNDSINGSWLL